MSLTEGPSSVRPDGLTGQIQFHSEGSPFRPKHIRRLRQWIASVIREKGKNLHSLSIVFCDDDYLHQVNLRYLKHDTLTDIITFPYSELPDIEGDILISVERVRENARLYHVSFSEELRRVMIHGVLHLCGLEDKTPEDKRQMRKAENEALSYWEELSN